MNKISNSYFLVFDALRSDHIKYMPWLSSKIGQGIYVKNLEISSGFCERSEIFFNLKPSETSFVNAITIDIDSKNKTRPFSWFPNWLKTPLVFLEKNLFLQKIIRRLLWKISLKKSSPTMYPQRIPLNILDKVILTEDAINFEEYSKKIESGLLWQYIQQGYKINWDYFTSLSGVTMGTDYSRLKTLSDNLSDYKKSFIPIYISMADVLGHKFGPHSKEIINGLKKLDLEIKEFHEKCIKDNKDSRISFLGDHGMEKVERSIDIQFIIDTICIKMNLKQGKDLFYFLDSTMFRVWWKSSNTEKFNLFSKELNSNKELKENGYFLSDEDCKNEGLPPVKDMGDIVWWAKKGIQISPDFFHNEGKTKAGMHGYLKKDKISSGFFLSISNDILPQSYNNLDASNLMEIYLGMK